MGVYSNSLDVQIVSGVSSVAVRPTGSVTANDLPYYIYCSRMRPRKLMVSWDEAKVRCFHQRGAGFCVMVP